jgi:type I restriction enzyme S subunit
MRNKMKFTATEEQARPALVPKLRFPEFRNLRGWSPTALYVIADPVTERAIQGEEDNVLSLSTEHGIVLQSEFFGKKVAGDNSERYLKIARNDFVYNDRTTKASTFGTIKRLSKHSGGIVSPIYKCFRFHTDEYPVFWEQYFETGNHDSALCGLVNEGARAGRFNISIRQFLSTAAPRPAEAEQQKIAKCLSSVDDLIAAQARKVDALKTHKKGLMQQLFPREGETQPRLRFPEFQNDGGEWEPTSLGGVARLRNGYAFKSADYVVDGPYQIITIANVQQASLAIESTKRMAALPSDIQQHQILSLGDILISMTGNVGRVCRVTAEGLLLNQRVGQLVPEEIDAAFFYQLLQRDEFRNTMQLKAAGGAQGNLSGGDITQYAFSAPTEPDEQQRIASCLSSLDSLITAETQKLETLKTHKKGLMQQLFLAPEESLP